MHLLVHTQPRSQSQLPPLPQTQPLSDNISLSFTRTPPLSSAEFFFNISKMPVRPRKKKKVSADVSTDNSQNKAPQAVDRDSTTSNAAAAAAATVISEMVTATTVVHNGNAIRVIPTIVSKKLSCEGEVSVAIRHLKAADPLLARVIDAHQSPSFDTSHPPFFALTKSILYQQLADKAATSIYTRFVSLCGGEAGVVPDAVLSFSVPQLREIGVSARKASYIHDLASKYHKGILSDASIIDMEDETLFEMLTMVNGIGPWTVHMFMIFSLHRPDVLPIGDLGVRKGVQFLYGLKQLPRPNQMEQLCEKWIPYRSLGAWYMWRLAGAKGTQASAAATTTATATSESRSDQ